MDDTDTENLLLYHDRLWDAIQIVALENMHFSYCLKIYMFPCIYSKYIAYMYVCSVGMSESAAHWTSTFRILFCSDCADCDECDDGMKKSIPTTHMDISAQK